MTGAAPSAGVAAGEPLPPDCVRIEVHVGELRQMFNAMDAAPFRDRDLDPNAEEFIVDWSREVGAEKSLALIVHLGREPATAEAQVVLQQATHEFFAHRAIGEQRRLQRLFRLGRTSLLIGVAFLGTAIAVGDALASVFEHSDFGELLREGLLVGGSVALWRPLEIFLYDWWPVRDEARLYARLADMPVRVVDAPSGER